MWENVQLNPMDRFFLTLHRVHTQRGLPGINCLACVELDRPVDTEAVQSAWIAAQQRFPLLRGPLRVESGFWRTAADDRSSATRITFLDASAEDAGEAALCRFAAAAMGRVPAAAAGPGGGRTIGGDDLRAAELLHVRLPNGRDWIGLVWPHALMDGAGGMALLEDVGANLSAAARAPGQRAADCLASAAGPSTELDKLPAGESKLASRQIGPAGDQVARWFRWTPRYVLRAARAHHEVRRINRLHGLRFHERRGRASLPVTLVQARWHGAAFESVKRNAEATCAAGPLLYSRFLLKATLRAVDAMREALGFHEREHYIVPFPMTWAEGVPASRLFHNHVTIATLVVPRSRLTDDAALDELLAGQIAAYASRRGERDFLALAELFGRMPAERYARAVEGRHAMPRYSFGFSSLRVSPAESFLGARVIAVGGGTLPPCPPGVMFNFCRAGGQLSLLTAAYPHCCTSGTAGQLTARIAAELGPS